MREAIINCYCHRDYDRNSNIKIEFFDDRCEIISPGSFYDGLTLSDALQGVQSFRNINLVRLLYKLDLIENYASGFARIFKSYRDYNKKPQVDILNMAVKICLFNLNYNDIKKEDKETLLSVNALKIFELIKNDASITSLKN